jgi:uncharacterized protein (TIGR03083 family)
VPDPDQLLAWIAQESDTFAATIRPDTLAARVPGCPDWNLHDLVSHLGRVQTMWAAVVRAGADVPPEFPAEVPGPASAGDLTAWMRAATADMVDALRSTPWDAPAWSWWRDDHVVGAIARHQVQEAAVHRWDAQSALGTPEPLPVALADDGVDEFLWVARQFRAEPAPIVLRAIDSQRAFAFSDEPALVTVSATASDLVLLLYGRVAPDAVEVVGDRAVLDATLFPVG